MTTVLSVIIAILVFAVLIIIHELGHYTSARLLGFGVEEFAIGFGPKIFTRVSKKSGIRYSVRAFPMGGFLRYYGEDSETSDGRGFNDQPVWKRVITVLSGPLANILVAYLAAVFLLTTYGVNGGATSQIAVIEENSPAYHAQLMEGDVLLAVDGQRSDDVQQIISWIGEKGELPMEITFERGGQENTVTVTPFFDSELGRARIGITMASARVTVGFFEAIPMAGEYVVMVVVETFNVFKGLIFGTQSTDSVMGFVGAVGVVSEGVRQGFEMVLNLAVLLSINLGVVNLLPLPALDGGRLVFLIIEGIRRKPIDPNKEGMVHFIGFALLMVLAVLLTYQDIARLITGG